MFFLATLAMTACDNYVCIDACDFYEATAGCRNGDGCDNVQQLNVSQLHDGFSCNGTKYPFDECSKELNLSGWATQLPTDLSHLFHGYNGSRIISLSGWNTESVVRMTSMFEELKISSIPGPQAVLPN